MIFCDCTGFSTRSLVRHRKVASEILSPLSAKFQQRAIWLAKRYGRSLSFYGASIWKLVHSLQLQEKLAESARVIDAKITIIDQKYLDVGCEQTFDEHEASS